MVVARANPVEEGGNGHMLGEADKLLSSDEEFRRLRTADKE